MNKSQKAAIKALERALVGMARSGLVMVSIDDNLYAAADTESLQEEMRRSSSCEAILARANSGHDDVADVRDPHQVFLSGAGA